MMIPIDVFQPSNHKHSAQINSSIEKIQVSFNEYQWEMYQQLNYKLNKFVFKETIADEFFLVEN